MDDERRVDVEWRDRLREGRVVPREILADGEDEASVNGVRGRCRRTRVDRPG